MRGNGYNLSIVKEENDERILEIIFKQAPVKRGDVARQLGLALPTITGRVSDLLERKILLEDGASAQVKEIGRKPQYLRINPEAGYAVGIELGPYITALCITDACGSVIDQAEYPRMCEDYDEMLDTTAGYVRQLLKNHRIAKNRVMGVGIGIPGFVRSTEGVVRDSFRKAWTQKPIAEDLTKKIGIKVIIDNNVRARITREELLARTHRPGNFLYYFISYGIAGSLMINHDVYSGLTAGAGEVGHMIILHDNVHTKDHLEDVASEAAILRTCRKAVKEGRAACLHAFADDLNKLSMKDILEAQNEGDPDIVQIMQDAVTYLGIGLANIVNFISPKLVIVDGYIMKNDANKKLLQKVLQDNLFGLNAEEVQVEFIPFDKFSGALGGAALVIKYIFLANQVNEPAR